jgi:hypothetical protein
MFFQNSKVKCDFAKTLNPFMMNPKPWIRKVGTSKGHLLIEKRTILEKWYTSFLF